MISRLELIKNLIRRKSLKDFLLEMMDNFWHKEDSLPGGGGSQGERGFGYIASLEILNFSTPDVGDVIVKNFQNADNAFQAGNRIRVIQFPNDENFFEGQITEKSGVNITIEVDYVSASAPGTSSNRWNVSLTGEKGNAGSDFPTLAEILQNNPGVSNIMDGQYIQVADNNLPYLKNAASQTQLGSDGSNGLHANDTDGNQSANFNDRCLYNEDGTVTLDWNNVIHQPLDITLLPGAESYFGVAGLVVEKLWIMGNDTIDAFSIGSSPGDDDILSERYIEADRGSRLITIDYSLDEDTTFYFKNLPSTTSIRLFLR